jgi:ribose transport system ATP-binding protein
VRAPSRTAVFALSGVTKVYPGVVALQDVGLSLHGGEVVGLIGENGAGKSTLMKVLGGVVRPDAGRIEVDGRVMAALTPAAAADLGIAFVHQELTPFPNIDVAGNILLGREIATGPWRRLDRAAMARAVQPILTLLGTRFGPADDVADLSLADQQLLEIARALSQKARLLILDEPTSSLTLSETQTLLRVIADLRAKGVAVLFISHRLAEVEAIADRVVALRDGRNAGELAKDAITRDRMVRLMIGRDLGRGTASHGVPGAPVLSVRGVRTQVHPGATVDLDLAAGEIVGLAGLIGAGRSELARALFGVDPREGEVHLNGVPVEPGSVAAALRAGLCLVPENRKEEGLILDFPIAANIALPSLAALVRGGLVDRAAETALAREGQRRLGIRASGPEQAATELSGGNQQKVVLAKWLALNPRVLILDEPTRGIDVGAKAEVYALMRQLARDGVAILMISSDMEEVLGVSDRVAVMARGRIAGLLGPEAMTEENVLQLAVG